HESHRRRAGAAPPMVSGNRLALPPRRARRAAQGAASPGLAPSLARGPRGVELRRQRMRAARAPRRRRFRARRGDGRAGARCAPSRRAMAIPQRLGGAGGWLVSLRRGRAGAARLTEAAGFAAPHRVEDHAAMAEYALLLASTTGAQMLATVDRTLRE